MQNENKKTIDVLNSLIEINNDRIEGYKHAAEETDDSTMKSLFTQMSQTSRDCKQELSKEVKNLGGTPKEGTATSGKLYRVWMDVRAALTNKDRKAILSSCETGEDVAVKAYEDAAKNEDVASEHRYLIKKQHGMIKADHDKMKNLRDAYIKA